MAEIYNVADMQNMVRSIVLTKVRQSYPNIDVSDNSVFDDLFVKPMVEIFRPLFLQLNSLELMMNLNNAAYMTEAELDEIGYGNYGLTRTPGIKATGVVTLSLSRIPYGSLTIPSAAVLETEDGLKFQTTESTTIEYSDLLLSYNSSTLTYDIDIDVEAIEIGDAYNVSANQITVLTTQFNNDVLYLKNSSAFTDGQDKESNTDYAARLKSYYLSRHLDTKTGYSEAILENIAGVTDIYVAGFGDTEMTRDEITVLEYATPITKHMGGKVDIYVMGSTYSTASETSIPVNSGLLRLVYSDATSVSVENLTDPSKNTTIQFIHPAGASPSDGLVQMINTLDRSYDSDSVSVLRVTYEHSGQTVTEDFNVGVTKVDLRSPVESIVKVYRDADPGTSYSSSYYSINRERVVDGITISDSSDPYYKTTQENSSITLNLDDLENGDLVSVEYTFNETLESIRTYFNEEENRVITADILSKAATPIYVNIAINIKMKTGNVLDDTKTNLINSLLSSYFSDLRLGDSISEGDIINLLLDNSTLSQSIDYIVCPLTSFYVPGDPSASITATRDGTTISSSNIEYLSLNKTSFVSV